MRIFVWIVIFGSFVLISACLGRALFVCVRESEDIIAWPREVGALHFVLRFEARGVFPPFLASRWGTNTTAVLGPSEISPDYASRV